MSALLHDHHARAIERDDLRQRHQLLLSLSQAARSSVNPDALTVLFLDSRAGELAKMLHYLGEDVSQPVPVKPPVLPEKPTAVQPVAPPIPEPAAAAFFQPVEQPVAQPVAPLPPAPETAGGFGQPRDRATPIKLPAGLPVIGHAPAAPAAKAGKPQLTYFFDPVRETMVWETPERKEEILQEARRLNLIE